MNTRYITASCLTVALGFVGIGTAAATTTDTPALSHEAAAGESATADISVTSSDALAGEQLSVLILDDDADASDPATDDIVFIEQYVLDETGAIDFSVQLPTAVLEDYDIALNTSADTDRYLASLIGTDEDDEGSDNGNETENPDDGATDEPDDGGTTGPDDGQTPGGDQSSGDGQTSDGADTGSGPDDDATGAAPADDSTGDDASSGSDDAPQAGEDQDSGGFLASTGANIVLAVVAGLVAIGLGMFSVVRRRRTAEE